MRWLDESHTFPPTSTASEEGIVALGGDLHPERLLQAYANGIFPWFDEESVILWWAPNPRCVLHVDQIKVSKSMCQLLRKKPFTITADTAFEQVIAHCQKIERPDQEGTWITNDMLQSYTRLHQMGYAHSVEVWRNEELVGGLYGLSLGNMFFGESMFSKQSNASKVAFITMVQQLKSKGFEYIDCQVENGHLTSLGATEVSREFFEIQLDKSLQNPTQKGSWSDWLFQK